MRRLALLIALVGVTACGDATGVIVSRRPPEETSPQQYPLRSVDGYPLPFLVGLTDTGQLEIVAGFIALTEAGRFFEQRTLWREIVGGEIREELLVVTGRFTRYPDGLEVVTTDGVVLFLPVIGGTIYYRDRLFDYAYWR
jgi:hypothetical protein